MNARQGWRLRLPSPRPGWTIVLDLELERLRFQLEKARREAFGQSLEAGARIGQFELALEDIEETLAAIEAADEMAAYETASNTAVAAFTRRKPDGARYPSICRASGRSIPARRRAHVAPVA